MKSLLGSVCVVAAIGVPAVASASVITGPVVNPANGHSYYLLSQNTWTASEAEAVGIGGHLATVNNAAENAWIFSTFGSATKDLWIGLYDPDPTVNATNRAARRLEFVWISGEPVTYSSWSSIEPNSLGGTSDPGGPEYYVHIWNSADPNSAFWNNSRNVQADFQNVGIFGVAEVIPEPSSLAMIAVGGITCLRRRGR